MFTGQIDTISNKATWQSDVCEIVDDEDNSVTDLSSVADLAIVVSIKDMDGCTLVSGSIEDGKVTVPGPGFQWRFEDTDLSNLCAGTYRFGIKVTIDGFITDLVDGTLAVIEGN